VRFLAPTAKLTLSRPREVALREIRPTAAGSERLERPAAVSPPPPGSAQWPTVVPFPAAIRSLLIRGSGIAPRTLAGWVMV